MNRTTQFSYIAQNASKMLEEILLNQVILRYAKYLIDNPLDESLPDISVDLMEAQDFLPHPIDYSSLLDEQVKLAFYPSKSKYTKESVLDIDVYQFDAIVPYKYWSVHGRSNYRVFRIAFEIAKLIDKKVIPGIGKVQITEWKMEKVNQQYGILSLLIEVTNGI